MSRSLRLIQYQSLFKSRRRISTTLAATSIQKPTSLTNFDAQPKKIFECVCEEHTRMRLDTYLTKMIPSRTRSQICHSIKSGFVKINDTPCKKPSYSIKLGDSIYYELNQRVPSHIEPENIPLDVVYEDDDIVVINKEVGMVVHPSAGHWSGTLVHALMYHSNVEAIELTQSPTTFESMNNLISDEDNNDNDDDEEVVFRPGIVHRLDRDTSGLLVVAKNDFIHAKLSDKFKNREVSRKYISVLIGRPKEHQNRIETNIDRDPRDRKCQKAIPKSSRKGRRAISNYWVLEANENWSLVSWKLETGRTHQIRAHAKYLGCPIMGDLDYGGNFKHFISKLKKRKPSKTILDEMMTEFPSRPMLHSQTLAFNHPRTEKPLSFSTKLPQDFEQCIDRLKLTST